MTKVTRHLSVVHVVKRRGEVEQDENVSVIAVDGIQKMLIFSAKKVDRSSAETASQARCLGASLDVFPDAE